MKRTPLRRGTKGLARRTPLAKTNKKRLDKRTKQYKAYMASAAWKGRRLAALAAADYTCQGCGQLMASLNPRLLRDVIESAVLHVHHKTYARFGHELLEDLEVLCESCHAQEHGSRFIKPRMMRAG